MLMRGVFNAMYIVYTVGSVYGKFYIVFSSWCSYQSHNFVFFFFFKVVILLSFEQIGRIFFICGTLPSTALYVYPLMTSAAEGGNVKM